VIAANALPLSEADVHLKMGLTSEEIMQQLSADNADVCSAFSSYLYILYTVASGRVVNTILMKNTAHIHTDAFFQN